MNLQDVLTTLGIPEAQELFEPYWAESENSYPQERPSFLQPQEIAFNREYIGIPAQVEPLLLHTAATIRGNAALSHLAWHCYRLLYECPDYGSFSRWPEPAAALGENAGVLYALINMAVVPLALTKHQSLGIPDEITRACCNRVKEPIDRYSIVHPGRFGTAMPSFGWVRHYTTGELYRIGRFEFIVRPFHGNLKAYRHRETREVLALAADGTHFRRDGYIDAEPTSEPGWVAQLEEADGTVRGCPITPKGFGLHKDVTLSLADWECALQPGDPVLEMHIPAGGGMTLDKCIASVREAAEFFRQRFPERPFVGFGCMSWILNPQLAEFYTPESNMILWGRELYLFPVPSGSRDGLYFVFGTNDIDPETAPHDTSLRRAILERIKSGGRLITGGMFLLADDLDHLGTQHYRANFPPSII